MRFALKILVTEATKESVRPRPDRVTAQLQGKVPSVHEEKEPRLRALIIFQNLHLPAYEMPSFQESSSTSEKHDRFQKSGEIIWERKDIATEGDCKREEISARSSLEIGVYSKPQLTACTEFLEKRNNRHPVSNKNRKNVLWTDYDSSSKFSRKRKNIHVNLFEGFYDDKKNYAYMNNGVQSSGAKVKRTKESQEEESVSTLAKGCFCSTSRDSCAITESKQKICCPKLDLRHIEEQDINKKPSYSYIALIAMAILSSPNKKLLLADIYRYIENRFHYFRHTGDSWKNSIRHNLSLNDCFVKMKRNESKKSSYWTIHPDNLQDFARGEFRQHKARLYSRRKCTKYSGQGSCFAWIASKTYPLMLKSPCFQQDRDNEVKNCTWLVGQSPGYLSRNVSVYRNCCSASLPWSLKMSVESNYASEITHKNISNSKILDNEYFHTSWKTAHAVTNEQSWEETFTRLQRQLKKIE